MVEGIRRVKVTYDPLKDDLMVGEHTLKEFYIAARLDAGISIGKLEEDAGITHPGLYNIEKPARPPKRPTGSVSTKYLLIALECLGYSLEING